MASNSQSKFRDFSVTLPNGMNISGIQYNPPAIKTSTPSKPLLVLIHGGTCTAHNFDVSPTNTASVEAGNLGIPVVSINRPGYLDSTALTDIPENSSYQQELGKSVYHKYLFPMLWERFGKPAGCSSVVLLGHSMAVMGMVIAAGAYADDDFPKYPLSGIILSGWGSRLTNFEVKIPEDQEGKTKWKQYIMLTHPDKHLADEAILPHIATQDHSIEVEIAGAQEAWTGAFFQMWRQYSDKIRVPVMFGIGEHDALWQGTIEHVKEYETMFPNCARFDGSVVLGAPHAIEWSYMATGWYARCFGFASEVSTLHSIREKNAVS
jgi:pimeloyl-ACP methyl ester carboxylesterase